jgi:hypothetical protein
MGNLKGTTRRFGSTSPGCIARWCGPKGGGGMAGNSQRLETSGEIGSSGLRRPIGQLGRCEAFRSGEEGGCSGLRWAKRSNRFWAARKNKKRFSDFDSRNEIQI